MRQITDDDTGLKVLYEPETATESGEDEKMVESVPTLLCPAGCRLSLTDGSIVAVHGLGAHPDDTWTQRRGSADDGTYVNWLQEKDMLAASVSDVRIMRYGYKSGWFGPDTIKQSVRQIAPRLLAALQRERRVSRIKRFKRQPEQHADISLDVSWPTFDLPCPQLRWSCGVKGEFKINSETNGGLY